MNSSSSKVKKKNFKSMKVGGTKTEEVGQTRVMPKKAKMVKSMIEMQKTSQYKSQEVPVESLQQSIPNDTCSNVAPEGLAVLSFGSSGGGNPKLQSPHDTRTHRRNDIQTGKIILDDFTNDQNRPASQDQIKKKNVHQKAVEYRKNLYSQGAAGMQQIRGLAGIN